MVENRAIFGKRALNTAMESNGNTYPLPPPLVLYCSCLGDACCPEVETRDNKKKYPCRSGEKSSEVGMYKNQLQELAQRSCFNLPSYGCIREGPDHAPRFKASVNFNGEIYESPSYCTTLRQAEHSAAEVALGTLSTRGPSRSLTARVLDETGVYKNLLQETAHRAGLNLPVYTTVRSGPGHVPVFTCIVELAGMNFSGEPAKTKKQAEKNAAMAAWSALKQMPNSSQTNKTTESNDEQEQVVVARVLSQFKPKEESRLVRQQRDLNQARRRVLSAYRDTNFVSTQNSLLVQYQQWRPMGLLADSFSSVVYPNQHQNQKHDHFLAELPPPTVLKPTSSRDKDSPFLCSPNRSIPVQIRSKPQVQEIPTPLEEHQKDEDEWFNGKPSIEKEPSKANSSSVMRATPTYQNSSPLHKAPMFHHRNQPTTQIKTPISFPRFLNTGSGYHGNGVAPAVHIRSVIPVCATPPARPSSTSSNISKPSLVKESSPPSSVSENHVSTHTEQEEVVTEASSKLNKLQL